MWVKQLRGISDDDYHTPLEAFFMMDWEYFEDATKPNLALVNMLNLVDLG